MASDTKNNSGIGTNKADEVSELRRELVGDRKYIEELELLLRQHGILLPTYRHVNSNSNTELKENSLDATRESARNSTNSNNAGDSSNNTVPGLLRDGNINSLVAMVEKVKGLIDYHFYTIHFHEINFWRTMPLRRIATVGTTIKSILCGKGKKVRVDILKNLTGRISPQKMTLVMGPPGSGKTTLLKALSGQLNTSGAHLEGDITYNNDSIHSKKYLISKVADYVSETDQHIATLTVKETLEFAWMATTGGHHSYGVAKDEKSAELLNSADNDMVKVQNVLRVLGLAECQDNMIGDDMHRGISGGQKRRVTLGEMMLPPRAVKYMDAITNGLDASTALDIIRALRYLSDSLGITLVISLLQPSPEVFNLFDDLILLHDGEIIYHGPRAQAESYFEELGYHCPEQVDFADYLEELPTNEGKRFRRSFSDGNHSETNPSNSSILQMHTTEAFVQAWKKSKIYQEMLSIMKQEDESVQSYVWPEVLKERYPGSFLFNTTASLARQVKFTIRDKTFLRVRIMQSLIVAAIAGSLFSDLAVTDTQTLLGILFFSSLFNALSSMSTLPIIYYQKSIFYKQSKAMFYPTLSFVISQTLVFYPLQIIEVILYSTIVYWSVGLSEDNYGGRFFTFIFILLSFSLCASQLFRMLASILPSEKIANPIGGILVILMVLFSGYIIPQKDIPDGWIWFYWINPVAYTLKSLSVNELLATDYDFLICTNPPVCSQLDRFGDVILRQRGNPTDQQWVWYGIAVILSEYFIFIILNTLALNYLRIEASPPAPLPTDKHIHHSEEIAVEQLTVTMKAEDTELSIPFQPATIAFQNIWYTIKLKKSGEELDILKDISGYFEPKTLTALMGSSGAGKTTLLDVLAGRKNTGIIKGEVLVNGKPVDGRSFKHIMGYVEQFDSLSPQDTVREAIEFSAALRLPKGTTNNVRQSWVDRVVDLLELESIKNSTVGEREAGGLSFEQKKRISIGVELAANPSVLFFDEPTSGLDSRSAQSVIRCIKRVAQSGRSVVCTIHQPSTYIFEEFDSLLLLKRGGKTVFFGKLGDHSEHLLSYFHSVPGVERMKPKQNPATWMLEVIGAGTTSNGNFLDFHKEYLQSQLCNETNEKLKELVATVDENDDGADADARERHTFQPLIMRTDIGKRLLRRKHTKKSFNASYWLQFQYVMLRFRKAYWRSPSYNFGRLLISLIVALIFSSTYANQNYTSDVDVISRCALIFITLLFTGVIGMTSVQPVMFSQRPAFYREQFSDLYDVKLYVLAGTIVEVPYLLLSSVIFLIPYFFIVGFDRGDVAVKFFWYWLYQGLYMSTLVFTGQFYASVFPTKGVSSVISAMTSTMLSLFCGFMIPPEDIPSFWTFIYWLNPLHYALEGVYVTQFHNDNTIITLFNGRKTTAEDFVFSFFSSWDYENRIIDFIVLLIFILALRIGTYFALTYIRHDKR